MILQLWIGDSRFEPGVDNLANKLKIIYFGPTNEYIKMKSNIKYYSVGVQFPPAEDEYEDDETLSSSSLSLSYVSVVRE